jgi:uncharacterized membrane protein YccC
MSDPAARPQAAGGPEQFLTEFQASRSYLASGLRGGGWLDFGQFNWHDVALGRAIRAALGVITPLAAGIAAGHTAYGSFAALGALPAGFVSFRGVSRTRVLAVAATALGMAVSTFAGAATSARPWLLVAEVMVWAYAVGLLAALGPTATAIALQWPVALLISSALPLDPRQAAIRAGLVLAGGLWQGALVMSTWALNRGSAERAALADSYLALSRYAAGLAAGAHGPPAPVALPGTAVLRDPNPLLRTDARRHLLDLLQEADRIRATLATIGSVTGDPAAAHPKPPEPGPHEPEPPEPGPHELEPHGPEPHEPGPPGPHEPEPHGPTAPGLVHLPADAAAVLRDVASALNARRGERGQRAEEARQRIAAIALAPGIRWRWAGEALLGQLRSAVRIIEELDDTEPGPARGRPPARRQRRAARRAAARAVYLTLRASLGNTSEAGRHALRLAAVAGVAAVLVQAAGLPHGYWGVLTVFIVLKPDYGSTLYRGVQRAAGTVLGAGLGVGTALLASTGTPVMLAGIGISLVAAYAVFTVNYLLYAVFLTDFVVVLLALLGLPADQTALARLAGTGVGAALALLAYLLWPTWEGSSANEKFARLLEAQGRYASALLRAYSRPAGAEQGGLHALQLTARRARSDAEASAARLADEPDRPPMTAELAQALVSAVHRLAQAALTADAAVGLRHRAGPRQLPRDAPAQPPRDPPDHPADRLQPALDRLAAGLTEAAGILAGSLRAMQPPGPLPPLRLLQAAIVPGPDAASGALFAATDGLVDAVNTVGDILRTHLVPAQPSPAS